MVALFSCIKTTRNNPIMIHEKHSSTPSAKVKRKLFHQNLNREVTHKHCIPHLLVYVLSGIWKGVQIFCLSKPAFWTQQRKVPNNRRMSKPNIAGLTKKALMRKHCMAQREQLASKNWFNPYIHQLFQLEKQPQPTNCARDLLSHINISSSVLYTYPFNEE